MAQPKLTLFLDVISPFAYIAFYVTKNSPVFKKCDVTYVPVFLGGIMKACDNRPPIEIKNKDKWIGIERKRWQKAFNVPMMDESPQPFPQPTINTQRALCAVEMSHPDKLGDCFAALYHAFWVEGQTIGKPEVIAPAITKALGEADAKKIMEQISTPAVKKKLTENSDDAMASGAFGLPWFVATNSKGDMEEFWGVDHMGQVVEHLGLERKEEQGLRAML